jgi:hypothetical protein
MKMHIKIMYIFITILLLNQIGLTYAYEITNQGNKNQPSIVYVDDDYTPSTPGWGYDHFDNIQDGINGVSNYGTVNIYPGVYSPFKIENRANIFIKSIDTTKPIIYGNQIVSDETYSPPISIKCVVFVYDSSDIIIDGLEIQGNDLSGRSYAVFYNGSSGSISNCIISPNQRGNMNSLGIRAQCNSILSIENSTIENYGRIGIYCKTGTVLNVYNNSIIGQIYTTSDGDFVSYGIEVEDLESASVAVIRNNYIYNHNYIGNPSWSSAGIIVDAWRYYEVTSENCSAVIEYNHIYENMIGLQIIPNKNIHINYNKIFDNSDYGVVSDPYWNGANHVYVDLDAKNNWWGDSTGPYHSSSNPNGLGDNITDNVIFIPWLEDYLPKISITNPEPGFLYFNHRDIIIFKIPFFTTFIIGKNYVDVDVTAGLFDIDRVEFYIDDEYKFTDYTSPYKWNWNDTTSFFTYTIKVFVYDTNGYKSSDSLKVWKLHYNLLNE